MDPLQLVVLALVQGITEFLPISSSAHLILVPVVTDWPDQGLAFDVAVHVGTLAAVVLYFRQEVAQMAVAWAGSLAGRGLDAEARLAWAVILATIPVGLAGLLLHDWIETHLRGAAVIAAASIGFGLLLWWADVAGRRERDEHSIGWRDVVIVGLAQALALIPGTSRSGITITAGLAVGLSRQAAARFAFLLAIPVIVLAGGLEALDLVTAVQAVDWVSLAGGTVLAGVSAFACIHLFLKALAHIGMWPFVAYRVVLGAVLWVLFV